MFILKCFVEVMGVGGVFGFGYVWVVMVLSRCSFLFFFGGGKDMGNNVLVVKKI